MIFTYIEGQRNENNKSNIEQALTNPNWFSKWINWTTGDTFIFGFVYWYNLTTEPLPLKTTIIRIFVCLCHFPYRSCSASSRRKRMRCNTSIGTDALRPAPRPKPFCYSTRSTAGQTVCIRERLLVYNVWRAILQIKNKTIYNKYNI